MLKDKLKGLPDSPGIYLFYNKKKELIYVGKATSLRSRVQSYFRHVIPTKVGILKKKIPAFAGMTPEGSRPIETMIHEVVDIKTIKTDSVLEAVILEGNYIKKFRPKYNVMWRDDKSWNYICITKDRYPKVEFVREHELTNTPPTPLKGGKNYSPLGGRLRGWLAHIFGPYPGLNTKEMMKLLRKLFFISDCQSRVGTRRGAFSQKPCFYYHLGQCLGVCTGEILPADYKKKVIHPLVLFLSGKTKAVIKDLQKLMKEAAIRHKFEEAGRIRDQIRQLNRIQDVALLNKSFVENKTIDYRLSTIVRVEGYDISNLGSSGKVGSMVVFENGEPKKSDYRKFKIKTVKGQSDVDCLEEVIVRRMNHVPQVESIKYRVESRNDWPLPDVILVDGGLPQVNRVVQTLRVRKIKIPVVGIAKGQTRKKNEFIIAKNTDDADFYADDADHADKRKRFVRWVEENQKLLIQVRDEAHRFAIKYQRSLRKL